MRHFRIKKTSRACILSILIFLLPAVLVTFQANAIKIGTNHSPQHKSDKEFDHDMLVGERLFFGLASFEAGKFNCEGCHYAAATDTMNWNPSATDLGRWMKDKSNTEIKTVFENPSSQKMEDAHKKIKITESEAGKLRRFLLYTAGKDLAPIKPFPLRLIIFFTFGLLMALALIDLIYTHYLRYRIIHYLVLIAGLAVHGYMAYREATNLSRTKGYAPDQPIKFSHKIHAGDNKIDCKYCHSGAMEGKSAIIPSIDLCMNCHKAVLNGRYSGKFEINKIKTALATNTPVAWTRVHKLPDHVFFSHAQHVNAGMIDCSKCHGAVETMDILAQAENLSMGWCVNCHRQTDVQLKNPYYQSASKLQDMIRSGKVRKVTAETVGGLDCMKCHY